MSQDENYGMKIWSYQMEHEIWGSYLSPFKCYEIPTNRMGKEDATNNSHGSIKNLN